MKSDKKFLIGLQLYLGILFYSITVGYLYAHYKNYDMKESMILSTTIGILSPFFLPIHYVLHNYVEDEEIESPFITHSVKAPIIVFKHLCSGSKNIKPKRL